MFVLGVLRVKNVLIIYQPGRLEDIQNEGMIEGVINATLQMTHAEPGLGIEESLYDRICLMEEKAPISRAEVEEVEAMVLRLVDTQLATRSPA